MEGGRGHGGQLPESAQSLKQALQDASNSRRRDVQDSGQALDGSKPLRRDFRGS